jgi:hypothetical protein
MTTITRRATCTCGQLHLDCTGDPVRVSVCHCLACQQRTGSVFGAQARFHRDQIRAQGQATTYVRVGDGGTPSTFHFCPVCGSTVYWVADAGRPPFTADFVAVAVGAFADPLFPPPRTSVYEARRHAWVLLDLADLERWD